MEGMQMKDTVALVTGGWRGIGRASVERLRRDGLRVSFSFVPGVEPEADIAAWVATDPGLLALPLDLRDPVAPDRAMAGLVAQWGGIDILVNNAAVGSATVAGFAQGQAAQDAAMLAINATGTLSMCRAFLAAPGMATRDGTGARKIISIASVGGGLAAFPGFSLADGMSKAAVAHLTRQLAAEAMAPGLDVFAICPGATDTEMFRQSTLNRLSDEERHAFLSRLPKERLIQPSEIAELVAFLAGPQSTILHGAVIDASMGLGVRPGRISETGH
jgi:NAD(P)-dependent dehydrogenase (short-subunit alcohol dehydrogenase family)